MVRNAAFSSVPTDNECVNPAGWKGYHWQWFVATYFVDSLPKTKLKRELIKDFFNWWLT